MRLRIHLLIAVTVVLVACNRNGAAAGGQQPPAPSLSASAETGNLPTLAPVLAKVFPTVVSISVQGSRTVTPETLLQDPVFRHFFNQRQGPVTERFVAAGSGVIIDAAHGFIVTNSHLIESAQQIRVILRDRSQYPAKLVGADSSTDIAVLRIEATNLSAVPLGSSRDLNAGDYVVAVGNPFGVGLTATFGIVSALGRTGLGIESYEDFIQTDASINPGNSGGALVNTAGHLVGMNTAILSGSGGNVGVGFAIPVDLIKTVSEQLIASGKVSRGAIGVAVQDMTPLLARAMGISENRGALVSEVMSGSPASASGLVPGDVVIALNGAPILSGADLRNSVGAMRPGTKITVKFLRDGKERQVSLLLQSGRAATEDARPATIKTPEAFQFPLGLKIGPVPRSDLHYRAERGAMVELTEAGSSAANAGLREGDIITGVDKKRVETPEDFARLVHEHVADRPLLIELRRQNMALFAAIEP